MTIQLIIFPKVCGESAGNRREEVRPSLVLLGHFVQPADHLPAPRRLLQILHGSLLDGQEPIHEHVEPSDQCGGPFPDLMLENVARSCESH